MFIQPNSMLAADGSEPVYAADVAVIQRLPDKLAEDGSEPAHAADTQSYNVFSTDGL
jgi:hypothetical protein